MISTNIAAPHQFQNIDIIVNVSVQKYWIYMSIWYSMLLYPFIWQLAVCQHNDEVHGKANHSSLWEHNGAMMVDTT